MLDLSDIGYLFEQPGLEEIVPIEQRIMMAVVNRAILDAISAIHDVSVPAQEKCTQRAKVWITSGCEDFQTVCHAAGYDPQEIRRKYTELQAEIDLTITPT